MATKKEMKMLQANYEHMLQSPLFVKMQKKILKLEAERKSLRRVIVELGFKLNLNKSLDTKNVDVKNDACDVIHITSDNDQCQENVKYTLDDNFTINTLDKEDVSELDEVAISEESGEEEVEESGEEEEEEEEGR